MSDALDLITENLSDMGAFLDGMAEVVAEWDDDDLVRLRSALDDTKRQVAGAIGAVETRAAAVIPQGETWQVPGAGVMSVAWSAGKATTNVPKLSAVLAARVADEAVDRETGEKLPPAELCARTAEEFVAVFPLTPSTRPRVGAMKERGLKPSEFVDYGDGAYRARWMP